MKIAEFLKSDTFRKITSIVTIVAAGVGGVVGAIADQKREKEFEDLKKAVADLQNK